MNPIKTTKKALRRFLLDTQHLLNPELEAGIQGTTGNTKNSSSQDKVLQMIQQLECVQIDPVSAVKPNQHLVLAARIADYQPEQLNQLLEQNKVFEYMANALCVIPIEDYALFEPTRRRIQQRLQNELHSLGDIVQQVLQSLEEKGPLMSKAFQTDQIVHGYWDNQQAKTKATTHALNLLTDTGKIRVVNREGNQRYFDLAERTIPAAVKTRAETISQEEASALLLEKYLRAYRVFEPSDPRFGWQKITAAQRREAIRSGIASGFIQAVKVEGVAKEYYILYSDIERLREYEDSNERVGSTHDLAVRFLPPLDNLLWSRQRLEDLFDFYYRWEIYVPAAKRQFGYYTMPILYGDRLVGRIDPLLDRKKQHLQINILKLENEEYKQDKLLKEKLLNEIKHFALRHGALTFSINQSDLL